MENEVQTEGLPAPNVIYPVFLGAYATWQMFDVQNGATRNREEILNTTIAIVVRSRSFL
jgi:hypothetical protein